MSTRRKWSSTFKFVGNSKSNARAILLPPLAPPLEAFVNPGEDIQEALLLSRFDLIISASEVLLKRLFGINPTFKVYIVRSKAARR